MNYNKDKAFTLVELMLAVMLTAIIILVAAAGTRTILEMKNRIKIHDRALTQALDVLDKIENDLSNICREKQNGRYSFRLKVGGSVKTACDRICFYTVGDNITANKSYIYEVEYGLLKSSDQRDSYQLGKRVGVVNDRATGNKRGKVIVIADSIKSLLFECWDGEKWLRTSPLNGSLPVMVRVTLELDGHIWATGQSAISRQISLLPIPDDIHTYDNETE